jgi:general secretion pathway protein G
MIQAGMTRKRMLILAGSVFLPAMVFLVFRVGGTTTCGAHDRARIQTAMVGAMLEQYRVDVGEYPAGLEQLLVSGPKRLGPYAKEGHLRDPWGRSLYYRVENNGRSFVLFTLGKDGLIGGKALDADLGTEDCADCSQ